MECDDGLECRCGVSIEGVRYGVGVMMRTQKQHVSHTRYSGVTNGQQASRPTQERGQSCHTTLQVALHCFTAHLGVWRMPSPILCKRGPDMMEFVEAGM